MQRNTNSFTWLLIIRATASASDICSPFSVVFLRIETDWSTRKMNAVGALRVICAV